MTKYVLLFIDPINSDNLVYINSPIDELCAEVSDDLSKYITKNKSEAYLFNTFEEAKKSLYTLKYYHRALKDLKCGVQRIEVEQLN